MTSKGRSSLSLLFAINCILKCFLIRTLKHLSKITNVRIKIIATLWNVHFFLTKFWGSSFFSFKTTLRMMRSPEALSFCVFSQLGSKKWKSFVAFGRKWPQDRYLTKLQCSTYTYIKVLFLDLTNAAKELSRKRIKDGKGRRQERAIQLKRSPQWTLRNAPRQMSGRMSYADEMRKWFKYKNLKLKGKVLIYRIMLSVLVWKAMFRVFN